MFGWQRKFSVLIKVSRVHYGEMGKAPTTHMKIHRPKSTKKTANSFVTRVCKVILGLGVTCTPMSILRESRDGLLQRSGNPYVCMYVCMCYFILFSAITLFLLRQGLGFLKTLMSQSTNHTTSDFFSISWTLCNF